MITNNIKINPEHWAEDHYKFHYDYIAPDNTLWNVDNLEDGFVLLWTIDAWGKFHYKNVTYSYFMQEWKEHK